MVELVDNRGEPIQAHAGGIIYEAATGLYYWFGENRAILDSQANWAWVSCYSSPDLQNWQNEGAALLPVQTDSSHDLHFSKVVERPKVIFNDLTRQYVMWLHIDTPDYSYARTGLAVSNTPRGPYTYLGSFRPHGMESRDFTVFKDDDGKAYLIYSSYGNKTMCISRLSADYLEPTGEVSHIFVDQLREAPCVFKHKGYYYLITSGCTGWEPNAAQYAITTSMLSAYWELMGNPCVGRGAETTFGSQGSFVLAISDKPGVFIFLADRWQKEQLSKSGYLWLPIELDQATPAKISIEWSDRVSQADILVSPDNS